MSKPDRVFDRDREWNGLASFASNPARGALLGVVSGRRRQGKSFLLEALTSVTGGLYFPSLEETEAVSLRTFSTALIRQGVPVTRPLQNWGDAIALLFSALRDQPRTVVIDEFPFLVKASPSLPSIIQRELGGIERARPPDIGAAGADSRKQAATGNQSHAGRCGRRPGPAALPRPLTCLDREQRRQRLGERNEIR